MSKRDEKGWSLWCDWLGCDYQWEYGDYTIFGDGWDADFWRAQLDAMKEARRG